jgi:hypothetical protein
MTLRFIYLLLGLFVIFVVALPFLVRVKIECQSQFGNCPDEIEVQLNKFNGKILYLAKQESSKYLAKSLLVSNFSMQFKVPSVLQINLLIKKPAYSILDKTTGKTGLVDKDGRIISISPNSSLPEVAVSGEDLQVGNKVSDQEFFDLELMQGIWQMYLVSLGEIQDNSLVVELPAGVTVILPQEGDKEILLGEVRLVYEKVESTNVANKYSQIDLRFKNPVLR